MFHFEKSYFFAIFFMDFSSLCYFNFFKRFFYFIYYIGYK